MNDIINSDIASRYLAAIVESSDDAILSKDLNGVITSWNKGAERIFGYTRDEAIGQHITFLIPKERLQEEDHIIGKIRSGERVDHFETVRKTKDGKDIYISVTVSPIRDNSGKIVGASKVARDITRQLQAERETARLYKRVQHSESQFRQLADSMPQIVWIAMPDGTVEYFNHQ